MLEKIGDSDIIVRDYTDNFSAKEYIQSELIPKAFPNIPISKLNAGFVGIVNEYMGQLTEDTYHTASLMLNENFITRAILPSSIYSEAGLFDLGYTFATPSKAQFAVQLWIDDVLERGQPIQGGTLIDSDVNRRDTGKYRYILDRDTKIIVGNNTYRFDYDIIIEWQRKYITGRELVPFKARYDIPDGTTGTTDFVNSIALQGSRWIKCRVTQQGWLILLVTLQEFNRKVITESITDNLKTTNSDIALTWPDQIAGIDLAHIDTKGQRRPMKKKLQYSNYETSPFAYYQFTDDNSINLSFSPAIPAWKPAFNDKIEATIYTTSGKAANFDSFDSELPVAVEKTGARYEYNADTHIVAICHSGSVLGSDKKDIEMLRSDVKLAYNTVKVLSTDHDLEEWFLNFAQRYDTRSTFFKRRDDPTGRLFSQFVAITDGNYIYPTNTLTIEVEQLPDPLNLKLCDLDYIDAGSNEFIVKPGHLWEYKVDGYDEVIDDNGIVSQVPRLSRTTVVMTKRSDGTPAMIYDNPLPRLDNIHRPFIFANPFLIKLHRQPQITACYNYLLHHTSFMQDTVINEASEFRHVQLSTFTVDRSLTERGSLGSADHVDGYTVRVLVNPILPENSIEEGFKYVKGDVSNPDASNFSENNLRLLMIFNTAVYGESGYLEMYPIKVHDGGIIEYEAKFATFDNVTKEGILIIDAESTKTKLLNPTITHLPDQRRPEIYRETIMLDAEESRFRVVAMMKIDKFVEDSLNSIPKDPLFGNPALAGWQVANEFTSDSHELTLFKPMTMMRSTVLFAGKIGQYKLRADLVPFVAHSLAHNDTELLKFIRQFNDQYAAVEPVIFERLDNNCHLDLKLFNTYGRSNNYFIGDGTDKHHLLDDVRVKISFQMSVKDRMAWTTTAEEVTTEIRDFFSELNSDGQPNVYISNLIRKIEVNHPNVDHLKFLGINNYDATEQYIRVRYQDVSDLDENELKIVVPEIIQCLPTDIQLIEEA